MAHRFATPSLAATILCRCGTEQKTNKAGKVAAHRGCAFSGQRLKAAYITARTVKAAAA